MTMAAILLLTLTVWILGPTLNIDFGTTAVLGLLATIITGNFGPRSIQDLDWSFLLFYGVALSIANVAESLGLNQAAAEVIGGQLLMVGASPFFFVLAVACLHIVIRFLFRPSQSVLLMSLTFIPAAPTLGVEPWVVVITILATAFLWFPPSQSSPFMTAYAASEGRLYSPGQAARVNFAYTAITLLGLAVSVPYWHLLGLL
jgi:divalent anion:Na+ symporter, DASS family